MADFNAGSIESTLTVDRTPFEQGLRAAQKQAEEWEKRRFTATLDVDVRQLEEKLRDAERSLGDFSDRDSTTRLDVDDSDVRERLADVEGRLGSLRDRTLRVRVDVDLEGLERGVGRAREQLDAIDGRTVRVTGDDGGSFARIGASSGRAFSSITTGATTAGGAMSRVRVIGGAVAAVFPLVAGAVAAVPAAIALIATPIAAVAVGLDGIKAAASQLKPEFESLRSVVSATFVQGLQPAIRDTRAVIPGLTQGLAGTASALSRVASSVTGVVSSSQGMRQVSTIFGRVNGIIASLAPVAATATTNLQTLTAQGVTGMSNLGAVMQETGRRWTVALDSMARTQTVQGAVSALVQVFGGLMNVIPPLVQVGAQLLQVFGPVLAAALNALATAVQLVGSAISVTMGWFQQLASVVGGTTNTLLTFGRALQSTNLPVISQLGVAMQAGAVQNEAYGQSANSAAAQMTQAADAAKLLTDRIAEQTQQFQDIVSASLGYEASLLRAREATDASAKAVAKYGVNSLQAQTAINTEATAYNNAALGAQRKAQALTASLGPQAQASAGSAVYISTLLQLADKAGPQAEAGLRTLAESYDASAAQAVIADAKARGFATTIETLPDGKTIEVLLEPEKYLAELERVQQQGKQPVTAPLDANSQAATSVAQQFFGLVTGANPQTQIQGSAAPATGVAQQFFGAIAAANPTAQIQGQVAPLQQSFGAAQGQIQGSNTTAPVAGNTALFTGAVNQAKGQAQAPATVPVNADTAQAAAALNAFRGQAQGIRPVIQVAANTVAATGALNQLRTAGNGIRPVIQVSANTGQAQAAITSLAGAVAGIRPVIQVSANTAAAQAAIVSFASAAAGVRPIIQVAANTGPAQSAVAAFVSTTSGLRPIIQVNANTGPARSQVAALVSYIRSQRPVITVTVRRVGAIGNADGAIMQKFAQGGIHGQPVRSFAAGGEFSEREWDNARPMASNLAEVVPPGTLRVIGDNPVADEAFIPLVPGSPRSQGLLEYTAAAMGRTLLPMAGGGLVGNQFGPGGQLAGLIGRLVSATRARASDSGADRIVAELQAQRSELRDLREDLAQLRSVTNHTVINNPVAERGSDSVNRRLRTLAALGTFE